jgi:tryptophan synthase alpha chain
LSRIKARFDSLKQSGRKALIPYIVAGDPEPGHTVALLHAMVEAGADILELGVPFSDPMAEGPTIALGHERALAHGVSLRSTLAMVAEFRQRDSDTPVLLMGYCNPVQRMGFTQFSQAAAEAGLDALLMVDMPPEEVGPLHECLQAAGLDNIFLVAPTSPSERIEKIARAASGFIYYVSLKGVTGAGHLDITEVAQRVAEIRTHSDLPVAVGFGIKDAQSAAAVAEVADGVVVGSALVQILADGAGSETEALANAVAGLIASIRAGIDVSNVGQ